jgi:hypothetical protein
MNSGPTNGCGATANGSATQCTMPDRCASPRGFSVIHLSTINCGVLFFSSAARVDTRPLPSGLSAKIDASDSANRRLTTTVSR